ncbi:MAG TPA: PA domain-containing protein [Thermoanaerobaculia bacterium]
MQSPAFLRTSAICLAIALGAASAPLAAATITIVNGNAPGVGFNDPTPATPVGGNTGTTVGEQRLIAFQYAADIWASKLKSNVEIRVRGSFIPLQCDATTGTLGQASATQSLKDFPGAPVPGTYYPVSLANAIAGTDLSSNDDISAQFNSAIGQTNCLDGSPWYYGLDNNHGPAIDLVTVLLHEFGHGLGFITLVNVNTGAEFLGSPDIWERNILDTSTGKHWVDMTDSERATSSLNGRKVVWDGAHVTAQAPSTLALGTPVVTVGSPASIAGDLAVGVADFGQPFFSPGVTGGLIAATDPSDSAGPSTTDGCSPFTNPAEVAGKIALIDRGTCLFTIKVKNAQDAGAIGVLIADNAAGSPPGGLGGFDATITIPSGRITMSDGATLRSNLSSGVTVTLGVDATLRSGEDRSGHVLLDATNPIQGGSTMSHWDPIAFPNLLMEPEISPDLPHDVDLTLPLLVDIGWTALTVPEGGPRPPVDAVPSDHRTHDLPPRN